MGTQILGKGHHFPKMTLVGVVDADVGLAGGDLRALEKSWQLLTQVAGRARGDGAAGEAAADGADGAGAASAAVLVQTRLPEHPVMRALVSGDAEAFAEGECEARRRAGMPPFGRLAALVLSSLQPSAVDGYARALAEAAPGVAARMPGMESVRVLGPAPAPLSVLRRRHRRRFLLRAPLGVRLQDYIRAWLASVRRPSSVRLVVDIDPHSFL